MSSPASQQQHLCGVADVRRRQAKVNVARRRPNVLSERGQECNDIVMNFCFDFADAFNCEGRFGANVVRSASVIFPLCQYSHAAISISRRLQTCAAATKACVFRESSVYSIMCILAKRFIHRGKLFKHFGNSYVRNNSIVETHAAALFTHHAVCERHVLVKNKLQHQRAQEV